MTSIKADDISRIIHEQIGGFQANVDVAEVGTVLSIGDGIAGIGQFCIDTRLAFALKGDVKKGLFFRGSESLPFGAAIRPVADLLEYLMTGAIPAGR